MGSNRKTARIAGLLYLVVVLTGIFSLMYVPSKLVIWDDAATTVRNIRTSETLYRLGIVAGVACYTAFLLLPLVLYALLREVHKHSAVAMVALAAASVPFSLLNLVSKVNVLTLVGNAPYLSGIDDTALSAQVMLYLDFYNNGIKIVSVFWGLWLLPFGYLVFKSGFLPKILGVLLMLGCFGYITNFIGGFLFPGYNSMGIARFVSLPASIGEIGICLWLLIVGIKEKQAA